MDVRIRRHSTLSVPGTITGNRGGYSDTQVRKRIRVWWIVMTYNKSDRLLVG